MFVEIQFCTPCIRAMVVESSCIAKSSLFIITCSGGTIGREAELHHAVVIHDPLVSKVHCLIYSLDSHSICLLSARFTV